MAMTARPNVLVIGGSDSSGGAGIARDIATLSHFGARASLAVTAVTVQTHAEVIAVEPMPASFVAAQMLAALSADPMRPSRSECWRRRKRCRQSPM
ncbi:bifunctional hydroxymethylpyrimidine kinase/phosphomethylpyrimidine kinase [Rhizobium aouanii]